MCNLYAGSFIMLIWKSLNKAAVIYSQLPEKTHRESVPLECYFFSLFNRVFNFS